MRAQNFLGQTSRTSRFILLSLLKSQGSRWLLKKIEILGWQGKKIESPLRLFCRKLSTLRRKESLKKRRLRYTYNSAKILRDPNFWQDHLPPLICLHLALGTWYRPLGYALRGGPRQISHTPRAMWITLHIMKLWIYEIHNFIFIFPGYITNQFSDQLPVGLLAQLVRALHRYRRVQGSNPGKPDFFRLSFRNRISCVNNCEDLLYIYFLYIT